VKPTSTCLQLDVGNSGAKWRLCIGDNVTARGNYLRSDSRTQNQLLNCADTLDNIWISSVATAEADAELAGLLLGQWGVQPWFAQTQASTGGLSNSYDEPARMGVDRWLAMLSARRREVGRFCVIDAGSALTIDLVSAAGQHEGGYIIPGATLMERALLLDTGRVRFAEEVGYALTPGTSTAAAVRHGIALAQAGSVALALDQAGDTPLALLYCGGGGEALMHLVQRGGQWLPDLVFEGLEIMAASR
jgi:type III pantothenate kinase